MAVIGFSYNKFDCERQKAPIKGSIEINHNINIDNVEKATVDMGNAKNEVLKIDFTFLVSYGTKLGKISISGDLIYSDTKEIIKETLKGWESDKKLNATVNPDIYKFIYNKGIIKAIDFADNLSLPAPVPVVPKNLFSGNKK